MNRPLYRRGFLATAAAGASSLILPAWPSGVAFAQSDLPMEVKPGDRTVGEPDAPIVMIEYASFTCPHCASFHVNTWPEIRDTYVADGQVLFVFREFARNQPDLAAGILARCVAEEQFFPMVDTLFHRQANWAAYDTQQTVQQLSQMGQLVGVDSAAYEACLNDQALADEIVDMRMEADQIYSVQATPTFIVNGEKVEGARDLAFFEEMFDRLLAS